MEQLVVSELAEKLSSMLTKNLIQEVSLVTKFKDDFEFICNEVNSIKCLLSDARGKRTSHASSTTHWLNELEDFLIDSMDIVEECENRKLNFLKVIIFHYSMGRKIRTLKERITKIHGGAKYLKYLTSVNANAGVQALNAYIESSEEEKRRKSNALLSQIRSVGIGESVRKVTEWVLEDRFRVIAVVGMGGLGKTCLVQDVFNSSEVRDHFDHLIWLTVSPKYLVQQLLLTTLSQIKLSDDQKLSEVSEEELIRDRINKHLQEKNKNLEKKGCLFVLDDVWDKNVWGQIGLQLQDQQSDRSKNKNKVLVTTRDYRVAQAIGADADHTHQMKPLPDADSWNLFCIHANLPERIEWNPPPPEDQSPTTVTSIAQRIVERCSGLPLAIKTIGASMARIRRIPNEWESILDRLNEADAITDSVMPSLRLSYEALPDPLKPCFLYCSAFPANTEIKSEYLAHVWIAEGFVSTSSQEARDASYEVARSYIDQLVGRCLMDSSVSGRDGRVKYCKMNESLHELALVESSKETKGLLKPGQALKELPVDECHEKRRISFVKNYISTIKDAMPSAGLRTLLLCNNIELKSISENFYDNLAYLTVLDLSETSINSLPTSIGKLRRLKFLNLSKTNIKILPPSLSGLRRLQYLNVSSCQHLNNLHVGIGQHKYMAYLNVKGCRNLKSLPGGISKLIYLRTLKGALVTKKDDLKEARDANLQWTDLKGLTRLQHLSVTVKVDAQSSSESQGCPEGIFGSMTNMRTLSIRNTSSSGPLLHLPDDTDRMERLEIVRLRNCAVPKWMSQRQNLMALVLEGNNSSEEYNVLQTIPNLKELRLSHNHKCDQFPREFGKPTAFSKLERLIIEDFDSLKFFDAAMPTLKYLRLKNCKVLKQMPQALMKLTELKEMEVECCETWEDGFWNESNDRDSTWKILNERRIKLTIDNFTISIERIIEKESKLKSAVENFKVSLTKTRSGRRWNFPA